jgi:hypothetical protein
MKLNVALQSNEKTSAEVCFPELLIYKPTIECELVKKQILTNLSYGIDDGRLYYNEFTPMFSVEKIYMSDPLTDDPRLKDNPDAKNHVELLNRMDFLKAIALTGDIAINTDLVIYPETTSVDNLLRFVYRDVFKKLRIPLNSGRHSVSFQATIPLQFRLPS